MFAFSTRPANLKVGQKGKPIWYLKVYTLERLVTKPGAPALYYLYDGPKRRFVREELLVLPPNTQVPPTQTM